MTVSEALAAHACAQIAAARERDEARRMAGESDQMEVVTESRSFVESWAFNATDIGVSRTN